MMRNFAPMRPHYQEASVLGVRSVLGIGVAARMVRSFSTLLVAFLTFAACSSDDGPGVGGPGKPDAGDPGSHDASFDIVINPDGPSTRFCDLPGSVQFTPDGMAMVNGGIGVDRIAFLTLPTGFCVHYFGNVGNTRQLRFSPTGDLFVASPTSGTTGGGAGGKAAILVLPDDDHDGVADTPLTFLGELPSTQGIMFAKDFFYYQNSTKILRRPYALGIAPCRRSPSSKSPTSRCTRRPGIGRSRSTRQTTEQSTWATVAIKAKPALRRTRFAGHPQDRRDTGGRVVAKGFRNPIAVRCQRGHNLCFAIELAMDFSAEFGGREKLVPIRDGDDWATPAASPRAARRRTSFRPPTARAPRPRASRS